jgi:hypothetical protein
VLLGSVNLSMRACVRTESQARDTRLGGSRDRLNEVWDGRIPQITNATDRRPPLSPKRVMSPDPVAGWVVTLTSGATGVPWLPVTEAVMRQADRRGCNDASRRGRGGVLGDGANV